MSVETVARRLVDDYRSQPTLRAGSLITTVFGDAIAPRGGEVWLGSLIRAMADFGINERLVRTSVYRLAQDGWLQAQQVGRRSYYSLTDSGKERFDQATHRIYGEPTRDWDGHWSLLLLSGLATGDKEAVRKECGWLGFGPLSANVLAHPAPDLDELDVTLRRLGVADDLVVLSGQTIRNDAGMRRLAHDCWKLDDLRERYGAFVKKFRPLAKALQKNGAADRTAFVLRTLLIQEYRKVLLRDPLLPVSLLPDGWPGSVSHELCRTIYRKLHAAADRHIGRVLETVDGSLPRRRRSTRNASAVSLKEQRNEPGKRNGETLRRPHVCKRSFVKSARHRDRRADGRRGDQWQWSSARTWSTGTTSCTAASCSRWPTPPLRSPATAMTTRRLPRRHRSSSCGPGCWAIA